MLVHTVDKLSRAILQTVAYSDIFEYPLTAREIHRYLTGERASLEEVIQTLEADGGCPRTGDYFTLPGQERLVSIRREREFRSKELLPRAIRYGRILGSLPFIRMVALTGSLAVMNVSKNADFDYMLVTAPGRVWTARAFALLVNRFTRLQGHTLCPNLIVSENALEWPLHDLYSARELYQMVPTTGLDVYHQLIKANEWAKEFLPNALEYTSLQDMQIKPVRERASAFQKFTEALLRGKLADRFERWEMDRKIERFSKQAGFGEETIFNAEVCQGNFHHHRKWTRGVYESKLAKLDIVYGSEIAEGQPPGTAARENR